MRFNKVKELKLTQGKSQMMKGQKSTRSEEI